VATSVLDSAVATGWEFDIDAYLVRICP